MASEKDTESTLTNLPIASQSWEGYLRQFPHFLKLPKEVRERLIVSSTSSKTTTLTGISTATEQSASEKPTTRSTGNEHSMGKQLRKRSFQGIQKDARLLHDVEGGDCVVTTVLADADTKQSGRMYDTSGDISKYIGNIKVGTLEARAPVQWYKYRVVLSCCR
eukprot:gb/GECG01006370.1/.p1 GENE.gb/GECG01006370.1/~~gb/GECG01006370.1/.p1  ORF type:complete len:163 (+),score=15.46 gb/GECG01006370.1/:1-489(+)